MGKMFKNIFFKDFWYMKEFNFPTWNSSTFANRYNNKNKKVTCFKRKKKRNYTIKKLV